MTLEGLAEAERQRAATKLQALVRGRAARLNILKRRPTATVTYADADADPNETTKKQQQQEEKVGHVTLPPPPLRPSKIQDIEEGGVRHIRLISKEWANVSLVVGMHPDEVIITTRLNQWRP